MLVERVYGDKNKTIFCNVPSLLPGDVLKQPLKVKAYKGLDKTFGQFSIGTFMARYLAGNRSLKQARGVSRKRLALVTSNIGYLDPEAYELSSQIKRYVKATKSVNNTQIHSSNSILSINGIIAKERNNTGEIRKVQNWVGSKSVFDAR
jgi:hypothetical protein